MWLPFKAFDKIFTMLKLMCCELNINGDEIQYHWGLMILVPHVVTQAIFFLNFFVHIFEFCNSKLKLTKFNYPYNHFFIH